MADSSKDIQLRELRVMHYSHVSEPICKIYPMTSKLVVLNFLVRIVE